MNTHPLYNNLLDYRGYGFAPTLFSKTSNHLLSVAKPKPSLFSKLSNLSLGKIGTVLGGAQKVLNIYNQVTPIIKQTKPMLANIKTTLRVAKAFKKFSKEDSLEKAFDHLPDFNESSSTVEKTDKATEVIDAQPVKKEMAYEYIEIREFKEDKKIPNPFFNLVD